jgi:dTDP-4-amino-4,6-dideoxygalactose transaminase
MRIPFSRVRCDGNELAYVSDVLASGWLTTASRAMELEQRFAAAVGARFACAVNSCTSALHLALEALGIGPGDEVLVPTMTFTATAEVVRYLGADPVFLDVECGTSLLTPSIVSAAIAQHPRAKALIVVHYGGQAAAMLSGPEKGILEICRDHGIRVVEDAAHAFPASDQGRPVGALGDITCFSFYANKTITTAEGGMLVTDDEGLATRARTMRLHGIDRDIWDRFTSNGAAWEYDVVAPGYKYNMSDLNAAVGLAQLERADVFRDARERCATYYLERLEGLAGLDLPQLRVPMSEHAWHLFAVTLTEGACVSRNQFIDTMFERGIGTSVHYKPLHRMTYYRERYGLSPDSFPNAETLWRGCVSLPLYASLSEGEIDEVCRAVENILNGGG